MFMLKHVEAREQLAGVGFCFLFLFFFRLWVQEIKLRSSGLVENTFVHRTIIFIFINIEASGIRGHRAMEDSGQGRGWPSKPSVEQELLPFCHPACSQRSRD